MAAKQQQQCKKYLQRKPLQICLLQLTLTYIFPIWEVINPNRHKENEETHITISNSDSNSDDVGYSNTPKNTIQNVGNGKINHIDDSNQNAHSIHNSNNNQTGVNNLNDVHHQQNGNICQYTKTSDYSQEKLTTVIPVQTQGNHEVTTSTAKALSPTKQFDGADWLWLTPKSIFL